MRERLVERLVPHQPVLDAGHLQDEDVVCVVVDVEAARRRRGHVNVGLHRVSEVVLQLPAEQAEWRPITMEGLENDRRAPIEQGYDAARVDEVVNFPRLQATPFRVARRRQRLTILHETDGREAKAPLDQYGVDLCKSEQ